jgi:hypothetical protein
MKAINDLAFDFEGRVSIRLIRSFDDRNVFSRQHILDNMPIDNNLHIITIDKFEIFITNIT